MLCTQADVEHRLQWDITAEPDPTITALIADAQATIEAEVGRPLESGPRTETFDGGPITLFLRFTPVTAVETVTEDGTPLTETDFMFKANGRLIRTTEAGFQTTWRTRKPQAITVEYTGGYVAASEESSSSSSPSSDDPLHLLALEHLGSICAEMVARAFRKGADSAAIPAGAAGGLQSVSLAGSDTVTYATGGEAEELAQFIYLTDNEKLQLARYKNLPVGFA